MADTFKLTRDVSGALVLAATGNPAVVLAVGSVVVAAAVVAWLCTEDEAPGKAVSRAAGPAGSRPSLHATLPADAGSSDLLEGPMIGFDQLRQRIEEKYQGKQHPAVTSPAPKSRQPGVEPPVVSTPMVESSPKPVVDAATEGAFVSLVRGLSSMQRESVARAFTSPPEAMAISLNACALSPEQVSALLMALGQLAAERSRT